MTIRASKVESESLGTSEVVEEPLIQTVLCNSMLTLIKASILMEFASAMEALEPLTTVMSRTLSWTIIMESSLARQSKLKFRFTLDSALTTGQQKATLNP
jgi:hypothetical protein